LFAPKESPQLIKQTNKNSIKDTTRSKTTDIGGRNKRINPNIKRSKEGTKQKRDTLFPPHQTFKKGLRKEGKGEDMEKGMKKEEKGN